MHRVKFIAEALPVVAVSAAFSATCSAAWAGRPLQAEDAGVIDPESCEIEGAHSEWRQRDRAQRQTYLQLGCGIGAGNELSLQALKPRELTLGGKTQLWRTGEAQFTLAWSLVNRPVASAWRHSGTGLIFVASAPWGRDWTAHANLGHVRDELQHRRSTTWALAAEHNGLGEDGRWQPMAEVFGDDRGQPWVNAALRVAVVPGQAFVDASLGRQWGGTRARLVTAGFKVAF